MCLSSVEPAGGDRGLAGVLIAGGRIWTPNLVISIFVISIFVISVRRELRRTAE
jgi:hypothetical protein